MTLPPDKIGDKRQRYEVQGRRRNGDWEPVGWTDKADGGSLLEGTRLWPRYTSARVVDRKQHAEQEDAR